MPAASARASPSWHIEPGLEYGTPARQPSIIIRPGRTDGRSALNEAWYHGVSGNVSFTERVNHFAEADKGATAVGDTPAAPRGQP